MRKAGFHPEPLGKDEARAMARAAALLSEWDAIRTTGEGSSSAPAHGTVDWVIAQYQKDQDYKDKRPKTQAEFDRLAAVIAEKWGRFRVAAIERKHIKGFYRDQIDARGVDRAARIIKTLHKLLEVARDEGLVMVNHASRMGLPQGNARNVVWSSDEVDAVVALAIKTGRRSIGLAVRIAYDLGQRLGDVLAMTWRQYDGSTIILTQGKTGATVMVPALHGLKLMLDQTKKAQEAAKLTSTHIVVSEETNRPYQADNFTHRFRDVANAAGQTGKQFLDLRRSAAVRLAEAGCTTEEITAITGHSIEHGAKILEVYIPRSSAMAATAIKKVAKANASGPKVRKR